MTLLLDKRFDNPKTLVLLSILALVSGAITTVYCFIGYLFLPLSAALLSALYLFDKSKYKFLSVGVTVLMLVADGLLTYFLGYIYTFCCLLAVGVALTMALTLAKEKTKAFSAAVSTCTLSVGFFLYLYVVGATVIGSADFVAVLDYYSYIVSQLREIFVGVALESAGALENSAELTAGTVALAFDMMVNSMIAYVAVAAFLLVGIAHKILSKLMLSFAADKARVERRRFLPNTVFAYFYVIANILTFFVSGTDAFMLTLANLVVVFRFVYAYLGFRIARAYLGERIKSGFVVYLVLIAATVMFSSMFVELLSIIGAVLCIVATHRRVSDDSDFNNNPEG